MLAAANRADLPSLSLWSTSAWFSNKISHTAAFPSNAAMRSGVMLSRSVWLGLAPLSRRRVTSLQSKWLSDFYSTMNGTHFAADSDSQVTATERAVLPSWSWISMSAPQMMSSLTQWRCPM